MYCHFITADEHYGHDNIIHLCNRPFTSMTEMVDTLIDRHNRKVENNPHLLTLHAGDMFWRTMLTDDIESILKRLHGRHAFLWGNHDEALERSLYLQSLFQFHSHVHVQNVAGHRLTVNHYAQRTWDGSHKGHWHVFGHSHGKLERESFNSGVLGKSFDIGVDSNRFEPWSMAEIAKRMESLPSHHRVEESRGNSMVEYPICNREVVGSSPTPGSNDDSPSGGCI